MKKIITLLLVFISSIFCIGQNITYPISQAVIQNPERGFFHELSTGISTANYSFVSASYLNTAKTTENITVIQRLFYMNDFLNSNISQAYLNNIQTDFNTIRNAGFKCTIRFAYSKSEAQASQQPKKAFILAHILQLAPVLEANKDVISAIQLGFIGTWGEGYNTNTAEFGTGNTGGYDTWTDLQYSNRKEIIDSCILNFPQEIPLQLRYIYFKTRSYGNSYVGRIGFYNDAFLNLWGDSGTFLVPLSTEVNIPQQDYLVLQTANLPMTGETDGINSPRTDCAGAMIEMDKYNWSQINKDYLQANITNWQTNGCYSEMDKRLGYRFELVNSTIQNNVLTLNIRNSGYANVFKDRKAFLVLKNTTTNAEYFFDLNQNLKNWVTNSITTIVQSLNLNVPSGQYHLYLNLPDPLNNSVAYSIQCANVGTWMANNGYNDLQQNVTISNLSIKVFVKGDNLQIEGINQYEIKIFDMTGKLVGNSLDISKLSNGIYIVKVNNVAFKIKK